MNISIQSKKRVIIALVCFITIGLIGGYLMYQVQKSSRAAGETIMLSFDPTSSTTTTTIKVKPSSAISLRGYHFQIAFDSSKISITDISYKIGTVSNGLGDDNTRLEQVNMKGQIKIQGELQNPTGQAMGTGLTDVATITFAKKDTTSSTVSINSLTSKFYSVGGDNSITEIPVVADAIFTVN